MNISHVDDLLQEQHRRDILAEVSQYRQVKEAQRGSQRQIKPQRAFTRMRAARRFFLAIAQMLTF